MAREPLNIALGKNIRRCRLAAGVSQEELAAKCGVHRTYLGAIERGERNVTLETVESLATGLGVDPLELLADSRRDKALTRLPKRRG